MYKLDRRALLRNGIILGSTALFGSQAMRLARAAESRTLTLYNGQHTHTTVALVKAFTQATGIKVAIRKGSRSEEHTSELQSLMRISYAVFCLKKKNTQHKQKNLTKKPNRN